MERERARRIPTPFGHTRMAPARMKVLHLSTYDSRAGAAKAAFRLHEGLRQLGVDSRLLVRYKCLDDDSVIEADRGVLGRISREVCTTLDHVPVRLYPHRNDASWSTGWLFQDIARQVRRMKPDIVHLHWVGRGFVPMSAVPRFGRPVVWTFHDAWPLTGGCHYPNGCSRFTASCGQCPQLGSRTERDITRWVWNRKSRYWNRTDISAIAASQWMYDTVQSSRLFRSRTLKLIRYHLDRSVFKPLDRETARRVFNLPEDRRIILMGAIRSTSDLRKGYQYLAEAVDHLAAWGWADKAVMVVFGASDPHSAKALSLKTRFFGRLDDDPSLALLYSAADATVVPSLEEAFGLTALESSSCGTPVVAFDVGGIGETVKQKQTGYLATPLDSLDLAKGIQWVLEDEQRRQVLGNRAREHTKQEFCPQESLTQHCDLYAQLLRKNAARSDTAQ